MVRQSHIQKGLQRVACSGGEAPGGQELGVILSDVGNTNGGEHIAHAAIPAFLNGIQKIVHAVLAQAVQLLQLLPVLCQMVDIGKVSDKAIFDQQAQPLLGQAQDIHGIPADKIGDPVQPDGGAAGIDTVEHFPAVVIAKLQELAAAAAPGGELIIGRPGEIVRDHGDDLVGLDDGDGIPQAQLQLLDDAHIVQRRPADGGAVDLHRVKNRHRVHLASAVGAPFNLPQDGFIPVLIEFKGQGMLGMVAGAAQIRAVGHIVEGAHNAVDGVAQGGAALLQILHGLIQAIQPLLPGFKPVFHISVRHHLKAKSRQEGKAAAVGVRSGNGCAGFIPCAVELPGDEADVSSGRHPAVQLAHGAADQIPGVFVFRVLPADDFPEGGIVDDALPIQNQLPCKGNPLGQIHKGSRIVGDVLPHLAVAPALGADQLSIAVQEGGGEPVHFPHEAQGLPLKIVGKFPYVRGFSQGQQRMVVGHLLQLAHGGVAHGGGGRIGIDDACFPFQPGQLIKKPVVFLVGDRAFILVVVGIPVLIQPVHQFFHVIHVKNVPFLPAWPVNGNMQSL